MYKMMSKDFSYTIRKSKRAKNMIIEVLPDASVRVTSPYRVGRSILESFVIENMKWIQKKLDYFKSIDSSTKLIFSKDDYLKNKKAAAELFKDRVHFYNKMYGFSFNKIYVKNQKTRWGSCSSTGNLNLNYKILFLPEDLRDYIIVHEICHLGEMNHSSRFWALVSRTFPNHKELRARLRKYELINSS
jgi:predicted metal-dependent hydrolase